MDRNSLNLKVNQFSVLIFNNLLYKILISKNLEQY